jgi:hypothetical protein
MTPLGHTVSMGGIRNSLKISMGKHEEKTLDGKFFIGGRIILK